MQNDARADAENASFKADKLCLSFQPLNENTSNVSLPADCSHFLYKFELKGKQTRILEPVSSVIFNCLLSAPPPFFWKDSLFHGFKRFVGFRLGFLFLYSCSAHQLNTGSLRQRLREVANDISNNNLNDSKRRLIL